MMAADLARKYSLEMDPSTATFQSARALSLSQPVTLSTECQ